VALETGAGSLRTILATEYLPAIVLPSIVTAETPLAGSLTIRHVLAYSNRSGSGSRPAKPSGKSVAFPAISSHVINVRLVREARTIGKTRVFSRPYLFDHLGVTHNATGFLRRFLNSAPRSMACVTL
jgi:hypothetical protein